MKVLLVCARIPNLTPPAEGAMVLYAVGEEAEDKAIDAVTAKAPREWKIEVVGPAEASLVVHLKLKPGEVRRL